MSTSRPTTGLMLLIGRPTLVDTWQLGFHTRDLRWQQYLQARQSPIRLYLTVPFFNRTTAQELLSTSTFSRLTLYVSLLELDHHQCSEILGGLTMLFQENGGPGPGSHHRPIRFYLEYEEGNPEHQDVLHLVDDHYQCENFFFFGFRNVRQDTPALLTSEGDDGFGLMPR